VSRNVHLITGPPGAGKSTHATTLGIPVFEREAYPSDDAFRRAVRTACAPADAQAAVIRCCPTPTDLAEWRTLTRASTVTTIATPRDECARRIYHRRRARWRSEIEAVDHWYQQRSPNPLQHKGSRRKPVDQDDW